MIGENYPTEFLKRQRVSEDGRTTSYDFVVPPRDYQAKTKEEAIVARAVWSAVDTIQPVALETKKGDQLQVAVSVCAERTHEAFFSQLQKANLDVVALVVREGDDIYTLRSQEALFGRVIDGAGEVGFPWFFKKHMDKALDTKVISPNGLWVASDGAFQGSAGVFPARERDSIRTAEFMPKYVTAQCMV